MQGRDAVSVFVKLKRQAVAWPRGIERLAIAGFFGFVPPFVIASVHAPAAGDLLTVAALLLGEPIALTMIAATVVVVLCVAGGKRFA